MKLSALLPTRNGLEYLRYAIETVRHQGDPDWELVISDNNSDQDIAGHVATLGDPRVVYVRTETTVSVTENWNNALHHSSGDYTIMLGDDDALLPGYFARVRGLIEEFHEPDAIYTNALLYAYPGVDPKAPGGYLQPYGYAPFFRRAEVPFVLDRGEARRLVAAAMDFRVRYGFNMQFALVSRRIAEEVAGSGEFFRSPFPDYYAMNMLLLTSERIVVEPEPSVVIGVTPKSYGFFHLNQLEEQAMELLASVDDTGSRDRLERVLLPGTNINTGWLLALDAVRAEADQPGLRPSLRRYRMLQALYVYQHYHLSSSIGEVDFRRLRTRLPTPMRVLCDIGFGIARVVCPTIPARARAALGYAFVLAQRQTPYYAPVRDPGHYANILEVCERWRAPTSAYQAPATAAHAGNMR